MTGIAAWSPERGWHDQTDAEHAEAQAATVARLTDTCPPCERGDNLRQDADRHTCGGCVRCGGGGAQGHSDDCPADRPTTHGGRPVHYHADSDLPWYGGPDADCHEAVA